MIEECEALHAYVRNLSGKGASSVGDVDLRVANADLSDDSDFYGATRVALVEQRIKQGFFRRTVLSGDGYKCCISGVSHKRLLIASHIVRWSDDSSIRLHPGNGLCLSAIHDRAFDSCLFSLTDDYRVVLSEQLKATNDRFLQDVFLHLEGSAIALPDKFAPNRNFISRHRSRLNKGEVAESLE